MAGLNLRDLDLKLLVVFETVYSTGNISRAADRLAMSQPAVSNALARLRELMGDPLFLRGRRGVEATVKAQRMIGPVRAALDLIGQQIGPEQEIDLATYRRTFRVIILDPLEPLMMPPILRLITDRAPGVAIESVTARPDFAEHVREGTVDLACFIYPVTAPDVVTVPLGTLDPVVVARRGHPAIGKTLDLETFCSLGHVTLVTDMRALARVDQDLAVHGARRRIVYQANRIWSFAPIVQRTDLIGMLPRRFAEAIADDFGLAIYEPPVTMSDQYSYMMWHSKNEHDPGHRWFREALLAAFPQAVAPADNVTPFPRPAAKVGRTGTGGRPTRAR